MPLTYAQLKALQARGKYADMDPKAFAALMGGMVGDPRQTSALADPSWLSMGEYGINRALDVTGLPRAAGEVGGALFGQTGSDVFESLPRSIANLAPLAIGGPAGIIGAGAAGFSQGWGQTEQFVPAAISGALSAATPGIAAIGGRAGVAATRGVMGDATQAGAALFREGAETGVDAAARALAASPLPRTGAEMAGKLVGEQGALLGAGVGGDALSIAADPNRSMDELMQPEYWAAQALANLPFIGVDLAQSRKAYGMGKAELNASKATYQKARQQDLFSQGTQMKPTRPAKGLPGVIPSGPTIDAMGPQFRVRSIGWAEPSGPAIPMGGRGGRQDMSGLVPDSNVPIPAGGPVQSQWLALLQDEAATVRPIEMQNAVEQAGARTEMDAPKMEGASDLQTVTNRVEANRLFGEGKELFAYSEFDEEMVSIDSLDMLDAYPPDSLYWREPERADVGETSDPGLVEFTDTEGLDVKTYKTKLREQLESTDPTEVATAARKSLPERERVWLGKIFAAKKAQGIEPTAAWHETTQIARSWAKSQLSDDRKTNILGDKVLLGAEKSMTGRDVHQQMEVNDWMEARTAKAKTDPAIAAELERVARFQDVAVENATNEFTSDKSVTDIYPAYRRWVEGKIAGKHKGKSLEAYLKTQYKGAAKVNVYDPRSKAPPKTRVESLDKLPANGRDVVEADLAAKAVANDDVDTVADVTARAVERGHDRIFDVVWPENISKNPDFAEALSIVKEGLQENATPQFLMDRLRMSLPAEKLAMLADPDFLAGVQKAARAAGLSKKQIAKALDGAVDPSQRAELEDLMRLRTFIEADAKQPGIVTQLYNMLRAFGGTKAQVATELPLLTRLWSFADTFKGVDLAALKTREGWKSQGLFASDVTGRRLVGVQTSRAEMMPWIVAHELVGHGLWDAHAKGKLDPLTSRRLDVFASAVKNMSTGERRQMLTDAAEVLPNRLRNDPEIQALLDSESGHADVDEVMANANAIAALSLVSAPRGRLAEMVRYLPKWFGDFVTSAADFARRGIDVLRGLSKGPERKIFDSHSRNLRAVMREARANEVAAAQLDLFNKMQNGDFSSFVKEPQMAEDTWADLLSDPESAKMAGTLVQYLGGKDLKNIPHLAGAGARRIGRLIAHTLQPIVQFGERDKGFRLFALQLMNEQAALQQHITQLGEIIGSAYDGTITTVGAKGPEHAVAKSPAASEALNKALSYINLKEKSFTGLETSGDVEFRKIIQNLSRDDLNNVRAAAANKRLYHAKTVEKERDLNYKFYAARAATASLKSATGDLLDLPYEPTYNLLLSKIPQHKSGVAVDSNALAAELTALGHDPAPALNVAESFVTLLGNADSRYAQQMKFDSYINESRRGAYKISYVDKNGVHGLRSADRLEDAEFLKKRTEDEGYLSVKLVEPTDFEARQHVKLNSDMEEIIADQTENLRKTMLAKGVDPVMVKELMDGFDLIQDIDRSQVSSRMGTLTVKRNFAPGRETLNMSEQQVLHNEQLLRNAQKRINEAVFIGMTRDHKYSKSPEAAAALTAWRNSMSPDSALTQGLSKFGYTYALGLNLPNYAQEWIQAVTGFPSKLIDEGASWREAYALVGRAQKDTMKMQASKKFMSGGELDMSHLSGPERAMLTDAMQRGMMGNGLLSETTADTRGAQYRKQKIDAGWLPDTPVSKTSEFADRAFNSVTRLHSKFTAGSTSASLLAAYRFSRNKGMTHAEATQNAFTLFYAGMHVGGRYNRPAGLWDTGAAKPVSAMISSLQSFTSSTIASTANYLRRALDGKLAKEDRKASASALANQVLVQSAIAGLLGLPLVGPMLALAEKTTGFDLQAELTKLAAQAEDPEKAAVYNEVALRGLFRAMGGPDVGARYGLGNVWGLNENDVFSFENVFGPVGSAIGRSVTAFGKLAKGDALGAAAEAAPVAIRKPLKMWSDEWEFRSREGNLLLDGATTAEKAMYSLGLQPQRLSRARESFNMIKRAREREHQEEIGFSRDVADMLGEGDTKGAQKAIADKAAEDDMDYEDLVERVANAMETRTFQARPTREGTRQTAELDAAISRGYSQQSPIDEQERETFKADIMAQLGAAPNEKRLREAAVIDEMRRKNPFLTVRQAKVLLDQQKGRTVKHQAAMQAWQR